MCYQWDALATLPFFALYPFSGVKHLVAGCFWRLKGCKSRCRMRNTWVKSDFKSKFQMQKKTSKPNKQVYTFVFGIYLWYYTFLFSVCPPVLLPSFFPTSNARPPSSSGAVHATRACPLKRWPWKAWKREGRENAPKNSFFVKKTFLSKKNKSWWNLMKSTAKHRVHTALLPLFQKKRRGPRPCEPKALPLVKILASQARPEQWLPLDQVTPGGPGRRRSMFFI